MDLSSFQYYQTITYTGCDQEVYQQDVVVHRSEGNAYEETVGGLNIWHVFVGDRCKNDYGDIRFTDGSGRELAYYIWSDFTSEIARFTVRLEDANLAGTLIIHYNNSFAETTSDGDATYFLHDHFNTLDLKKWVVIDGSGLSVSGGELYVSSDGGMSNSNTVLISSKIVVPSNILIQFRIKSRTHFTGVGVGSADYTGFGSAIGLSYYDRYESAIYTGTATCGEWWIPPRSTHYLSTEGDIIPDPPTGYYVEEFVVPAGEPLKERRNCGEWTISSRYNGVTESLPLHICHYRGYGEMHLDYILVRSYSQNPPSLISSSGERQMMSKMRYSPISFGSSSMMIV